MPTSWWSDIRLDRSLIKDRDNLEARELTAAGVAKGLDSIPFDLYVSPQRAQALRFADG